MTQLIDYIIFSACSFFGNVGVAMTGFGMAIIFLFVLQIAVLTGYSSNFKYAVFIQTISLLSVQPLLLHKAGIKRNASRRMLLYFLPTTVISTPLGQLAAENVSTDIVKMAGGILVTFIAILEIQQKRKVFLSWIWSFVYKIEPIKERLVGSKKGYAKLDEELSSSDRIKKKALDAKPVQALSAEHSKNSNKYLETNNDIDVSDTDEEWSDHYIFDQNNFKEFKEGNSLNDQLVEEHCKCYDFRRLTGLKEEKPKSKNEEEFVVEHWEDHVDFVRVKQEFQKESESEEENIGQEWEGHISISTKSQRTTESRRDQQVIIEIMREPIGPLGPKAGFWTILASAASGYLGGFCGIRGPPIILYFLHPPSPVSFTKESQRATGAVITAVNVTSRFIYYAVRTFALGDQDEVRFDASDYGLYISIIISSLLGVLIGSEIFNMMKDSRKTVRCILSIFLLLCGVSLLLSSFVMI